MESKLEQIQDVIYIMNEETNHREFIVEVSSEVYKEIEEDIVNYCTSSSDKDKDLPKDVELVYWNGFKIYMSVKNTDNFIVYTKDAV